MNDFLIETGDCMGIGERLKEIDKGYKIFFNKKTQHFEVYNDSKGKLLLEIVVPFEQIDARLIPYVRKSRVERMDSFVREMEEENKRIFTKEQEDTIERTKFLCKEKLKEMKAKYGF